MTITEAIETLERRRKHLSARIAMSSKDLSYDKQEQTALAMAVETLTREREARKIHRRTRGAEA